MEGHEQSSRLQNGANVAIRASIQTHALSGPYIRDPDGVLLSTLGAKSTTDCFVIDKALTLCYRGAIDDQYGFGYALAKPRLPLLVNAIEAVVAGRTPQTSATDAPGCLLNLKHPKTKSASSVSNEGLTYHNRIFAYHSSELCFQQSQILISHNYLRRHGF